MKKYPSMEEMFADCEKKKRADETIVFALGTGRMMPMLGKVKAMKAGVEFVKEQEGFLGVHPIDVWHNLLIFDTLNNAKGARNNMKAKGIPVGQVVPILIPTEYVKRANE